MPIASENHSPSNPPVKVGHKFINKMGFKHGMLTVIELFDVTCRYGGARWRCQCECGRVVVIRSAALKRTRSCGCLIGRSIKHGDASGNKRTTEYKTWDSIKFRCGNSKCDMYKHYGGRGIKVCDRWLNSFPNFLADMGRKPSPEYCIERINNDGDYEPSNCKWATNIEEQNNRRNNVPMMLNGRTQNMAQWARELGIGRWRIWYRLKAGWSDVEALTIPVNASKQRFKKR